MSGQDDVGKLLGKWLGKSKPLSEPPRPEETRDMLKRPEHGRPADDGDITQLNFKIPQAMKKRIKQLAVRDNITLLTMLDRMLELYEREHGAIER